MPVCTFIVPTLGRPTLGRALDSLRAQTNPDWEAIVVGDGVEPDRDLIRGDRRIDMSCYGPGFGSAGLVRNFALMRVEMICAVPPRWIAFLDDDDHLTPHYVEHLVEQEELHPDADVIVSRMKHTKLGVLPRPDNILRFGLVGISFAVKAETMQGRKFIEGLGQDWGLIEGLLKDGKKIHVSPHIDYLVREAK